MNRLLAASAILVLLIGSSIAQEVFYRHTDENNIISFVDKSRNTKCCYCYEAASYSVSRAGEKYTFVVDSLDASGRPVQGERVVEKGRTFVADDGGLYWCQNEAPWALHEAVPAPCGSVFPPS